MNRLVYVWAAYTVVWVGVFVYTLVLARRQKRLGQELELVRELVVDKKTPNWGGETDAT
ncbi:MAG: hypothetical protein PWP65_1618 [Clostridia bacterium]|nr:hypothetical protein [Clostridia bacterium]